MIQPTPKYKIIYSFDIANNKNDVVIYLYDNHISNIMQIASKVSFDEQPHTIHITRVYD